MEQQCLYNAILTLPHGQLVVCSYSRVTGSGLYIIGDHNELTITQSYVHGDYNTVTGTHTILYGNHNQITGNHHTIYGSHNHTQCTAESIATYGDTNTVVNVTSRSCRVVSGNLYRDTPPMPMPLIQALQQQRRQRQRHQRPLPTGDVCKIDLTTDDDDDDNTPSPSHTIRVEADEATDEGDVKYACIICLERKRKCAAMPCRHLRFCHTCCLQMMTKKQQDSLSCPECRQLVTHFEPFY